jgi:hypothetical protein
VAVCIPSPNLQLHFIIGIYTSNLYFSYYDGRPWQIYMLLGQLIVILFILHPVLYQVEMNAVNVLWNIAVVVIFGIVLTLVSMVFVYIADLHQELHMIQQLQKPQHVD